MKNLNFKEENPPLNMIPERCCCPLECKILEELARLNSVIREAHADEMGTIEWLDSYQVAQMLHVSIRTVTNMRTSGLLNYSRFGRKYFYLKSDIEAILKNNYVLNKIGYFNQKK